MSKKNHINISMTAEQIWFFHDALVIFKPHRYYNADIRKAILKKRIL